MVYDKLFITGITLYGSIWKCDLWKVTNRYSQFYTELKP
jgi:hypothetical protein